MNNFNVHDEYKDKTIDELKKISDNDRLPFSVCLFNLEYDLNIGNCVRSAHLLGARNVYVFGRHRVDARAAVGAKNYTNIIRHTFDKPEDMTDNEIAREFWKMKMEQDIFPIFIEKTTTSKSINDMTDYLISSTILKNISNVNICLIVGNENRGIPNCILDKYFYPVFHIPQFGVIRSFNVASAASISMYELSKSLNNIL
jgi:tRNA G18 (ribose-2'-O)-methylase SpoU